MPKTKSKKVSFARGFRLPTEDEVNKALGDHSPFSNEFKSTFNPVPEPTDELDWLAKYRLQGQTYAEYLDECPWIDRRDPARKIIYLTLLDNDDESSLLDIERLVDYTQRFFQMTVKILPFFSELHWDEKKKTWLCNTAASKRSTNIALRSRYHASTGHSQIEVQSVLNQIKNALPTDACCLVAVTMHDFYSDETDLFIAGLARGNSSVAAFSFFRYDPRLTFSEEFWYDWKCKKTKSKSLKQTILLRSCRLLTHEIGHLLGLDHCIYYGCLMNGSGHLKEDFSQPLFLCPVDLRKIGRLSNFDFIERYERLLEFCEENQFKNESRLLKKRLAILKDDQAGEKRKLDDSADTQTKRRKK